MLIKTKLYGSLKVKMWGYYYYYLLFIFFAKNNYFKLKTLIFQMVVHSKYRFIVSTMLLFIYLFNYYVLIGWWVGLCPEDMPVLKYMTV